MKKITVFALLALTLGTVSPAIGDDAEELRILQSPSTAGWIGADFIDTEYFGTSLLSSSNAQGEENVNDWRTVICDSVADTRCRIPGYHYNITSIFSPCSEKVTINCVESLKATLPNGNVVEGTPKRLWNPQGEYVGDPTLGIPDGGQASTWTLKDSNPSGSEDYIVVAGATGYVNIPSSASQPINPNDYFANLFATIQPIKEISGNYSDPKMHLFARGTTGVGLGGGVYAHQGCVMNDVTTCALRSAFPLDVTYSLTMRFERRFSQWLTGRLIDPSISIQELTGTKSVLTISAKPMIVPQVGGYIKWSDAPESLKAKYPAGTGGTGGSGGPDKDPTYDFTVQDLNLRTLRVGYGSSGTRAINAFKEWIPFLQDKPLAMKTNWTVRGIQDPPSQRMQQCAQNKFAGIVTSNAAVFSAGAPSWNQTDQTLDYTVGAPHYDTQGKLLTGQYVLSMKSDVARCIYGFTNAPISARVEIASEDGSPNVATTVLNENKATGMLTLTAAGFHYSVPKLAVKLLQEIPAVTPAQVTKSITCVKGKLKKTVKGTSPKCPTGYKKA
jgi:hypothetical protein